jgi:hypothetical protein
MVSVLAASAVDRGFRLRSGQIKDNKIGIYCPRSGGGFAPRGPYQGAATLSSPHTPHRIFRPP